MSIHKFKYSSHTGKCSWDVSWFDQLVQVSIVSGSMSIELWSMAGMEEAAEDRRWSFMTPVRKQPKHVPSGCIPSVVARKTRADRLLEMEVVLRVHYCKWAVAVLSSELEARRLKRLRSSKHRWNPEVHKKWTPTKCSITTVRHDLQNSQNAFQTQNNEMNANKERNQKNIACGTSRDTVW